MAASHAEVALGPLRDPLSAEDVSEVCINPDGAVFVERSGASHMAPLDVAMTGPLAKQLAAQLAGEAGSALGRDRPLVSGSITAFGRPMRVQITAPPAIEAGVAVSIRKYVSHSLALDGVGWLQGGQVDVEAERRQKVEDILSLARKGALATLLREAVAMKLNILVAGGTNSGKTTLARALLAETDRRERIVTIEDAAELRLPHPNAVALIAERRDDSGRSVTKLLEATLRMRPDRLVLGEMRGAEALSFLEAINTGHPGSISTVHADSPALALERLALMVMRSGLRLGRGDVLAYARATIDLVVQVGHRDGRRGVLEVVVPSVSAHPTTSALAAE